MANSYTVLTEIFSSNTEAFALELLDIEEVFPRTTYKAICLACSNLQSHLSVLLPRECVLCTGNEKFKFIIIRVNRRI